MDIYIQSTIGPCTEFMSENNTKEEISVVISPLKITSKDEILKVSNGCNMFTACQNSKCQYSLAGLHLRAGKIKEGAK